MNNKTQAIRRLIHDLKYDEEYADLSGYVKDLEWLINQQTSLVGALKTANDAYYDMREECLEIKRQYAQTTQKMKQLTNNRKEYVRKIQEIKRLVNQ